MFNLDNAKVTSIQFFDYSFEQFVSETETETVKQYSADVVLNDNLIIQLSGLGDEAHLPSVPQSHEIYRHDAALQDWAAENLDIDDVVAFLDSQDVENNFDYLSEHAA